MSDPPSTSARPSQNLGLRRDVTVWGSFMWGYSDVGADIYAALGLVIVSAHGAAGLAFGIAGLIYLMIGLGYTELASAYPVAGGGPYFALRGLGDFWGYLTGIALLLDYTIDIALFTVFTAGYFNYFWRHLLGHPVVTHALQLGPLTVYDPVLAGEALLLIVGLVIVNIRGVKSSLVTELLGAIDIATESSLVIFGFVFAWKPSLLALQWQDAMAHLPLRDFAYASSLAIISFIGLESISQAAHETRRPATIIPRTSLTLIFTVFLFALSFSNLALGMLPWQSFQSDKSDPLAMLADHLPFIGIVAGPFAAFLGVTILAISANSGIMSASRLTFSLSQLKLVTPWFEQVHAKFRTPVRTIVFFSAIGAVQVALSSFTPDLLDTLANLYAFGATLAYILVLLALIKLRFADPYTPRPYHMPLNLRWKRKQGGPPVSVPLLAILGTLGVSTIFLEVVITHRIGRVAGPAWVLLALVYYFFYRRSAKLPVLGSVARDWEQEQIDVLTSAEELDLLEQYKNALAERERSRT